MFLRESARAAKNGADVINDGGLLGMKHLRGRSP